MLDAFKTKQKKGKRKNATKEQNGEKMNFEEYTNVDSYVSFQQMNLSRPLLKV